MADHESVKVRSAGLLREMRLAEDLSLRDMADRLPCSKSTIHALENGDMKTCTKVLGDLIAEVLGQKPRVLFAPAPSVKRGRPAKDRGQGEAA